MDTAELYSTTAAVGDAITACAVPRDELWITSKLKGLPSGPYESVLARAKALLADLKVDRVDLLLVHWPGRVHAMDGGPEACMAASDWAYFEANVQQAWTNMHRLVEDGIATRVGVSNFGVAHLAHLATVCPSLPTPFANQVFIDAVHPQHTLVDYCQANGVAVMAYRSWRLCLCMAWPLAWVMAPPLRCKPWWQRPRLPTRTTSSCRGSTLDTSPPWPNPRPWNT